MRERDLRLVSSKEAARASMGAVTEAEVVDARRDQLPRVFLARQLAPREEAAAVEDVGGGEDGGVGAAVSGADEGGAAGEDGAVGELDGLLDFAGDGCWGGVVLA